MTNLDPAAVKAREQATWTATAPGWRRHDDLISQGTVTVSERMIERAGIAQGQRVLDVASGTGEPALTIADRVGPTGFVLGTDLTEAMLAVARQKLQARGVSHVEFRCVDAEQVDVGDDHVDAVTCRFGLMFMPDPVACLRHLHTALRPGGRIATATWAEPPRNPFLSMPLSVVRRHVDVPPPVPGAPGIFAFADPDRLRGALEEAGFSDVTVEELPVTVMEVPSGEVFWDITQDLAGPIMALMRDLPPDRRAAIGAEVAQAAEAYREGDVVRVGGVAWIASGRKR